MLGLSEQTWGVLNEVLEERNRPEKKWGPQNHDGPLYLTILTEEVGETAQAICDYRYKGTLPARAEHIREELIQVAAVAVAMVEAWDRGHCR